MIYLNNYNFIKYYIKKDIYIKINKMSKNNIQIFIYLYFFNIINI